MWELVITRRIFDGRADVESTVTRTSEYGFEWEPVVPGHDVRTYTFSATDGNWTAVFTDVVSIEATFTGEDKDESMTKEPASAPDESLPRASAHE